MLYNNYTMTLHYSFPENITLDEVRELVKKNSNFYLGERDGYVVANYLVAGKDTHPPVIDRDTAILRELRGMIFHPNGHVLSRRFHKFFNLGEREDLAAIDISKPHVVLEKLDGSMITPVPINGKIRWCTKMGITDVAGPVEKFIVSSNIREQYELLAEHFLPDFTPIFEWCSNKQRIVISHPEDRLVLLTIRDNSTGLYLPREAISYFLSMVPNIPYVDMLEPISDLKKFTEELRKREDIEDVVIMFDDGHMVKIKTDTYVALHTAKAMLENERNVIGLILENKTDDLYPLLSGPDLDRLHQFSSEVKSDISAFCFEVNNILLWLREHNATRKSFALENNDIDPILRMFVFKYFEGNCTTEAVVKFVLDHLGSNRSFEKCSRIIRHKWKEVKLND